MLITIQRVLLFQPTRVRTSSELRRGRPGQGDMCPARWPSWDSWDSLKVHRGSVGVGLWSSLGSRLANSVSV